MNEPDNSVLDRISNAHWSVGRDYAGKTVDGVCFLDIYEHNRCNHTLSGRVEVEGKTYGFIIESGDWNGTLVRKWGDPEEVGVFRHPDPPEPYTFIPRDPAYMQAFRPGLWKVYMAWREEKWFRDKEIGYNYDRHFAPGVVTERHYAEWADKKGMKIGRWSQVEIMTPEQIEAYKAETEAIQKFAEEMDGNS